jgi:hypothetical protein
MTPEWASLPDKPSDSSWTVILLKNGNEYKSYYDKDCDAWCFYGVYDKRFTEMVVKWRVLDDLREQK